MWGIGSIFCSRMILTCPPHFLSPLSLTRNNIKMSFFELHLYHNLYYSASLSGPHVEYPQPKLPQFVHANVIKNGTVEHLHVSNYLLHLYVKSHDLFHAHTLFDEIPERDVRSWTMLISGLVQVGCYGMALVTFSKMQKEGVMPNQFTFSSVLKCCSRVNEVRMGKAIHGWILSNGILLDVTLENSILDVYVKCGSFDCAKTFFELMSGRDTVSWNIMINGYIQIGNMENALSLFRRLPIKDIASWNTIIDGHLQIGSQRIAMELLYQMVKGGPAFNRVTFSIALVLASSLTVLELGRQIHSRLLRIGIHFDNFVRNSLIDMYCKCGQMEKASFVYQSLPQASVSQQYSKITCDEPLTDSFLCSSMVTGYVQNGKLQDALKMFSTMVSNRVEVDKFTLTSIVSACANAGLLELGQLIHAHIMKTGQHPDIFLSSSMIDMYAKCGRLGDAWSIFRQTNDRNIVLWTTMISSYALNGHGREAIELFDWMRSEGMKPNEVSFVGVLTACSHAGLLNEGINYFKLMKEVYGINPQVEHFTCMVDLFGRAGRLDEIKDFIHKNNISHLAPVWRAFLSSCRIHKNIETARWVSAKLLELEPLTAEPYVSLSNMCAADHRWDEAANVRGLMQARGVKKDPGQSWITS